MAKLMECEIIHIRRRSEKLSSRGFAGVAGYASDAGLEQVFTGRTPCKQEKKLNLGADCRPANGEIMHGIQVVTPARCDVHLELPITMQMQPLDKLAYGVPWRLLFSALVSVLSISTAHYIGYIKNLPPQVALAGGSLLIAGVTLTFVLFVTAVAVISRMLAVYIGSVSAMLLSLPANSRVLFSMRIGNRKTVLRKAQRSERIEPWIAVIFQSLFFLLFFVAYYMREPYVLPDYWMLVAICLLILSLLHRVRFFSVRPTRYWQRLKSRRGVDFALNFYSRAFIGVSGLALLLAFVAGEARMRHVQFLAPTAIKAEHYSGIAQILIRYGDMTLLREIVNGQENFILLEPTGSIRISGGKQAAKLFP